MGEPRLLREIISVKHKEIEVAIRALGASELTTPHILQKHAEILDLTAQLAEISTRRIIRLTWALCWLTVALLVTSIVTLAVILK